MLDGQSEIRPVFNTTVPVTELRQKPKYNKGWANLRPPQKGEVRNPRGRPKKDLDLAALAQSHARKAIETLVEVMGDATATPSARVGAASELLDRGFGRAPQHIDMNATVSLSAEFEAFIRRLSPGHDAKVIEHEAEDAEVVG